MTSHIQYNRYFFRWITNYFFYSTVGQLPNCLGVFLCNLRNRRTIWYDLWF